MTAPSSEQEAKEIASEVQARPRLQAVTDRMQDEIERLKSLPPDDPTRNRIIGLECLLGSLDVGLGGRDISEAEYEDTMRTLGPARG